MIFIDFDQERRCHFGHNYLPYLPFPHSKTPNQIYFQIVKHCKPTFKNKTQKTSYKAYNQSESTIENSS